LPPRTPSISIYLSSFSHSSGTHFFSFSLNSSCRAAAQESIYLMRSGTLCIRLLSATRRSADYPAALIRPLISSRRGQATSRPAPNRPNTHLIPAYTARTYTMSSSAGQPQPDKTEASSAGASSSAAAKTEPELPPLTDHEFLQYNRLAETMDYFVRLTRGQLLSAYDLPLPP
jgi:hypothetical protein